MADLYARISCTLAYDGRRNFPWLQSGMRLNFRTISMPEGSFLPNLGFEVDEIVQHGTTGNARIDVVADAVAWNLLVKGAEFTLHDGPSEVVAHGVVSSVTHPVDTPLAESTRSPE